MDTAEVQVGSTITNGSSALRITERVERDPRWGTPSWRGLCVPLEAFGGNVGMTDTVPDYLLGSWRDVPFEWRPVVGGGLEERYVWTADWRGLQREVRQMMAFPRAEAAAVALEDPPISRSPLGHLTSTTVQRDARWWELPEADQRQARQGALAFVAGTTNAITCPDCGANPVVYNGNYFCDGWVFPGPAVPEEGECEWALPHPAIRKRDREVCDLIGIDYA